MTDINAYLVNSYLKHDKQGNEMFCESIPRIVFFSTMTEAYSFMISEGYEDWEFDIKEISIVKGAQILVASAGPVGVVEE